MHELSIATSLVSLASEALRNAGELRPIEAVRVRVGDLAGVVIEALEFAWPVAAEGTACERASLEIERVPGRVRCGSCGAETELAVPPRFACGTCGAPTAEIVAGRELDLVSLELTDTTPPAVPPAHTEAHR